MMIEIRAEKLSDGSEVFTVFASEGDLGVAFDTVDEASAQSLYDALQKHAYSIAAVRNRASSLRPAPALRGMDGADWGAS